MSRAPSSSDDSLWAELRPLWNAETATENTPTHSTTHSAASDTLAKDAAARDAFAEKQAITVPSDLTQRVRRQQWFGAAMQLLEVAIVAAAWVLCLELWRRDNASEQVVSIVLGSIVLLALGWSIQYRRGLWQAPANTPLAHLDYLIQRNRAQSRYLSSSIVLLVLEVVLFLAWLPLRRDPSSDAGDYAFLTLWSAGILLLLIVLIRRNRREATTLALMARELDP